MVKPVSRRSFVAGIGALGSAVIARGALLVPETLVVASTSTDLVAPPGVDPNRQARYRYIGGARLARALELANGRADVRAAQGQLRAHGVPDAAVSSSGIEIYWDDGAPIAQILLTAHGSARAGERGATLIHWTSFNGKSATSVATWAGDESDRRVWRADEGRIGYVGRIRRRNDGSSEVDLAGGEHLIVPAYPKRLSTSGKHGLASRSSDIAICWPECDWQCTFTCSVVCSTILEQTCEISAACGGLAFACLAVCSIAVVVSCTYGCGEYCNFSCHLVCTMLQDPIGTTIY